MNKIKRKYIIAVAVICVIGLSVFFTNAQFIQPLYEDLEWNKYDSAFFNDGFTSWWGFEEKVTTELIPCSSDSNSYTRIDIHRKYGIPQFGIVTNCEGKTLDTVWYPILKDASRYEGMIISPVETDTSITVYLEREKHPSFGIMIIDVLTGSLSHLYLNEGLSSDAFENNPWPSTFHISDSIGGPITDSISFPYGSPRNIKDEYLKYGSTLNYSNLPNGLYFLFIISANFNNNFTIPYMRTICKGIERREIIEE
jgi:hypothetical protein